MELGPSEHVGSLRASGTLIDGAGIPIAGEPIQVTLTPLEGPGTLQTYSLSGTVPAGTAEAVVGFRVNTECGCAGESGFALYDASYTAGGGSSSLVPDGDFSNALDGWGLSGEGVARVQPSDRGEGSMLAVQASPDQSLLANSALFPVEAGQPYTVSFEAKVAPSSVGSGYFALVFLGARGEIDRRRILFLPASFDIGTRITDETGAFRATFHAPGIQLSLGKVLIEAWFPGDERLWPDYGMGTITA